jgi:adenosylcobinamide kinase/adenosylcobinamide-phosphate guanylyltransferase
MIHFVLGGARSGKSRFAEQETISLAKQQNKQAVYIATATTVDDEMVQRINQHQQDRINKGHHWQLIECPLALAQQLTHIDQDESVYLLDCLTLWLNNQLFSQQDLDKQLHEEHLKEEIKVLITTLSQFNADIVIVSNEVGLGIIPLGESTRLYVDYCGWLNQQVAEIAEQVTLVTAGIPLLIKSSEATRK